jgi:hypothetical protein
MIGRRHLLDDWCLLICLADRRDQSCGRKTDGQHSRKGRWSLPDERGVATTPTDRRKAKHALLPIAAVAQQKRGCSSTNSSDQEAADTGNCAESEEESQLLAAFSRVFIEIRWKVEENSP